MGKKTSPGLKQSLLKIAERVNKDTTLEEVYEQLAMLTDIEQSEEDVKKGRVYSQQQVEEKAKRWLK